MDHSNSLPTPSGDAGAAFLGRRDELLLTTQFLEAISTGGHVLTFSGDLGTGKSAILRRTAREGAALGYRVLRAEGTIEESALSYGALHMLLFPILDRRGGLNDVQRAAMESALGLSNSPVPDPLFVMNSALTLLSMAAEEAPVLLVIDDVDRLDPETALVLSFLAHRLSSVRVGLVCAATDPGARRWGGTMVELGRLDERTAEQVVHTLNPALPPAARHLVLEHAQGNPMALNELGRASVNVGDMRTVFDLPLRWAPQLSSLGTLSEEAQSAVLLLALDRRRSLQTLARAGHHPDVLEPAERAGILRVDARSRSAVFSHPLTPLAVVARVSGTERRRAHLLLARTPGISVEDRAHHLAEAAIEADETTAGLLEESSRAAETRGDLEAAARSLSDAARLSPDPAQRRRRWARAAFLAIDTDDGGSYSLPRGDERPADGSSGSLYAAVAAAFSQLHTTITCATACQMINSAVLAGDHGWKSSDPELLDALRAWLPLLWAAGQEDLWDDFFAALDRLTPGVPEPLRTLAIAFSDSVRATPADRDRIRRLVAETDHRDSEQGVIVSTAAMFFDLLEPGIPNALRTIEAGRSTELSRPALRAQAVVALHYFGRGRWSEAGALVENATEQAQSTPDWSCQVTSLYVGALLSAARGEPDCTDRIGRLEEIAHRVGGSGLLRFATHAHVLHAASRGDWEGVYREASALSPAGDLPRYVPQAVWVAFELVEAALRFGRPDEARAHLAEMRRWDVAALSPRLEMLTHAAAGLTAGPDGWREPFERALATPSAADFAFDYARVQLAFGSRLRRERRTSEARGQLHGAVTAFDRLGARPWAQRAREELRAARATVDVQPTLGLLTSQERLVAEFAAEGLSNKEIGKRLFLSSRTVSGHLYRVFPKLGIVSRSALRDALVATVE